MPSLRTALLRIVLAAVGTAIFLFLVGEFRRGGAATFYGSLLVVYAAYEIWGVYNGRRKNQSASSAG